MVSLEEISRHDQPFITRHRSRRWASTGGGISRRIHSWNRHTLQEFVDSHPPFLPIDPRSIQIQVCDLGHATRSVHNHISLKHARHLASDCPDNQLTRALFDPDRFGSQMNLNAKFASSLNELINEIRVKKGKRTRATMEDCDLRSHTRRYMREFKGDIPASDKENPPREFVQLQELVTCRKVLNAGNLQICRYLPGRHNEVPSLQCLFP